MVSAPSLDPITLELVKQRARIDRRRDGVDPGAHRLLGQPEERDGLSSAICDADMHLIAQGLTLPLHLGSLPDAMKAVRARYGDAIGRATSTS